MTELLDKLLLRVIFITILCLILLLYKYIYFLIYKGSKRWFTQEVNSKENTAEIICFLSKIVGIAIIFSNFNIDISGGVLLSIIDIIIKSIFAFVIYVSSLYIIDNTIFYNFEYQLEVIKRNNIPYAIINLTHSLAFSYLIKNILSISNFSIVVLFILWMLAIVICSLASKAYYWIFHIKLENAISQKDLAESFSYLGFMLGCTLLITSSFNNELIHFQGFFIKMILKVLLSLIILPVFIWSIKLIYNINIELKQSENRLLEHGIYKGAVFFVASSLTMVVTGNINFGIFYLTN